MFSKILRNVHFKRMPTVFYLEACHTQIFYLIPPNLDRTRLFIYIFYFPIANGNAKNCI